MRFSAKILAMLLLATGYQGFSQNFSLQFDGGNNDAVFIPTSADIAFNNNFTIQAWIYPTTVSANTVVISKGATDTGAMGYAIYLETTDNRITARVGDASFEVSADLAWQLNTWTHVAIVHSGSNLELYVDGGLKDTRSTPPDVQIDSAPLVIGGISGTFTSAQYFTGSIDEVLIFNAVRTPGGSYFDEFANNTGSLVSAYHFNEGAGTSAPDNATTNSSSTDNGSFTNSPTWDSNVPFYSVPSTITVTSNADAGPGTLREAIALANTLRFTTDTINIQLDFTTAILPVQTYGVNGQMRIYGQDNDIDGQNNIGLFNLFNPWSSLELRDIRLVNGRDAIVNDGSLRLESCSMENNEASAQSGGAIRSMGASSQLNISNSSFIGNSARFDGGAIVMNAGQATIVNSNFANNQADGNGGAFSATASGAVHTLINCTFTNNLADADANLSGVGDALYLVSDGSNSSLYNNIVYGNGTTDIQIDSSTPTDHLNNFVGSCGGFCPTGYDANDPQLETTLSTCGGIVQYYELEETSPAIDLASATSPPNNDICGNLRNDGFVDAGASEFGSGMAVPSVFTGYQIDQGIGLSFSTLSSPTALSLADEDITSAISLGFDFRFFDVTYTNVYIASNGYLTFLPSAASGVRGMPDMTSPNAVIAGFWGDLDPSAAGGSVSYELLGTAPDREFIVQYSSVLHSSGGNPVTMQIKLFETKDDIEIHCQNCPSPAGENHTQGIEDELGDASYVALGRNFQVFNLSNDGIRFRPTYGGGMEPGFTFGLKEDFEDALPPAFANGLYSLLTGDWEFVNVREEDTNAFGGDAAARMDHTSASSEIITPEMDGDSTVTFQYAAADVGEFGFQVISSVDGAPFTTVEFSADAMAPSYSEATFDLNYPGAVVQLKIVSDGGVNSADLLIDDFEAAFLTPIITIRSPIPFDTLNQQSTVIVDWLEVNVDSTEVIVVEYSPDAGLTWQTLVSDTSRLLRGNFEWLVDSTLFAVTNDSRLQVRTVDNRVSSGFHFFSIGPADFGTGEYAVSQTTFGFETLSSPMTLTPALQDEQVSASPIPLGFDFNYFGNTFDDMYVGSNGFVTFDFTSDACCEQQIPDPSTPNNLIAGYWGDLDPSSPFSGDIRYETLGTSPNRRFVIHFDSIEHYDGGTFADFQIKLFETTNEIEIHCASCEMDGDLHTQGIEGPFGQRAAFFSGRDEGIFQLTNDAIRFAPAPTRFDTVMVGGVEHVHIRDVGLGVGTRTFESSRVYVLHGRVFVNRGQTLTIQPGTIVKGRATGDPEDVAVLIVARGGTINAVGTSASPIIFTSDRDDLLPPVTNANLEGSSLLISDRGLWGGLYVLGNAPITNIMDVDSLQVEGLFNSGDRSYYGGTIPAESSGTLQYISIRHTGAELDIGSESNSLLLAGVGSGTTVSHVEIYAGNDDGVEFFGGSVNVTNVLVNGVSDDAIDISQGYTGTLDNFKINALGTDHALEVDGPEGSLNPTASFNLLNGTVRGFDGEMATFNTGARATLNSMYFFDFEDPMIDGDGDVELLDDATSANYANNDLDFVNFEFTLQGSSLADVFVDKAPAPSSGISSDATNFASVVLPANNTQGADESVFNNWTLTGFDPQATLEVATLKEAGGEVIPPGANGFFIYEFKWRAVNAAVESQRFIMGLEGSYARSDFAATNPIELYFNVGTNDAENATFFGTSDFGTDTLQSNEFGFNFNQTLPSGSEIYFYVKAVLDPGATLGRDFRIKRPIPEDFEVTAPSVVSTGQASEGSTFTITDFQNTTRFDSVNVLGVPHIIITDLGAGLGDYAMVKDNVYILNGRILLAPGDTLTIQPGTIIKGTTPDQFDVGALIVARGAFIQAIGTATEPIIFTSEQDNILPPVSPTNLIGSSLQLSDVARWGGLFVMGNAPISDMDGDGEELLEGAPANEDRAYFGGPNPLDNSGTLQYVSIRHGGFEAEGLYLGGVGSGTTIDHIEILAMEDDGLEVMGGTVDVSSVLVNDAKDDAIDVDLAYGGVIDNFRILAPRSDNALEVDGPEGVAVDTVAFQNGIIEGGTGDIATFRSRAMGIMRNVFSTGYPSPADPAGKGQIEIADDITAQIYFDDSLKFENLEFYYGTTVPINNVVVDSSAMDMSGVSGDVGDFVSVLLTQGTETVGLTDANAFNGWTATQFTPESSAVFLSGTLPSDSVQAGTADFLIYELAFEARFGAVTLDSVILEMTGTYDGNDFGAAPFDLRYGIDNEDFSAAVSLGDQSFGTGSPLPTNQIAWPVGQTVNDGSVMYLFVTVDVDSLATGSNTFSLVQPNTANFFFNTTVNKVATSLSAGATYAIRQDDTTLPVVTVDSLLVNVASPVLSGTIDDVAATVSVTVDGSSYSATVNSDSTWQLPAGTITPDLVDGVYEVLAVATDPVGNFSQDTTSNELTVDLITPLVGFDTLSTIATSPRLTGAVDDSTAVVQVLLLDSAYNATNNGNGTWEIAENTVVPLAVGAYDVIVTGSDVAQNIRQDTTVNGLRILSTTPVANEASQVTVSSFTASWSDVGPTATGYFLDVALDTAFSQPVTGFDALQVSTTTADVTGLDYSTNYFYRVKAQFADGAFSDYSTTIAVRTITDPGTAADSLALVSFFENLGGDEWKRNDHWLVGRLRDWYGIEFAEARVRAIRLDTNNLVGVVPDLVDALGLVTTISVKGNEIIQLEQRVWSQFTIHPGYV